MSELDLSKEMVSVEGYLADARLIVEKRIGKLPYDLYTKTVIEVARLLQIERHHKKPRTEKASTPKPPTTDQVMSSARANPQVPPMMSSTPSEEEPKPVKRSHKKKAPVEVKPAPTPSRRVATPTEKRAQAKPQAKAQTKPERKPSRRR